MPARSIRRIRLNRNPYALQFRRPGKARVEVYTEEPSNRRYRGAISFALRNAAFDARNAFAPVQPNLNRQLFDVDLAGPVVRGRSGFFLNAEHYRNNETAVVNARTLEGPFLANVATPERRSRLIGRYDDRSELHTLNAHYSYVDDREENRGAGRLHLPEQGTPSAQTVHRVQFSEIGRASCRERV